jgi:hypothetical protein
VEKNSTIGTFILLTIGESHRFQIYHVSRSLPAIPDSGISPVRFWSRVLSSLKPFQSSPGLNGGTHIHPLLIWFALRTSHLLEIRYRALCPVFSWTPEYPRVLCTFQVLPCQSRDSSLVRKRYFSLLAITTLCASPKSSYLFQCYPIRLVFDGCCHPIWKLDLPVVISENPSLHARTPIPAASVVHLTVSSHRTSAFLTHGTSRRLH